MPTYEVDVTRIETYQVVYEINAESEEEVKDAFHDGQVTDVVHESMLDDEEYINVIRVMKSEIEDETI